MDLELVDAFSNYLLERGNSDTIEPLIAALGQAKLLMERDLLEHYARHGAGDLLVTEASSVFIGRRAWVGPVLPASAAAGDIWYDVVEAMPMILIAREPHPWSVPKEDYPPLFGWLGCRPVANWQYRGYLQATGKPNPTEDGAGAAVGLTFSEAESYTRWFGKFLSEHLIWQAVPYHLPESVIEEMWEGVSYEWSRLRSDVSEELALVVPKEDYNADPDEVLAAHYSDLKNPQVREFALLPDSHNNLIGLRPTVSIQLGFIADRPW